MSKPLEGVTFTGVWGESGWYEMMWEDVDEHERRRITVLDPVGYWAVQSPSEDYAEGRARNLDEAKATAVAVAKLLGATFTEEPNP